MAKHLRRKVAYIQGLAEGINLGQSREGRILENMIRVMEDMTAEIDHLHLRCDELETYMGSIDEDLQDLEEDVYDDLADEYVVHDYDRADYVEVECPGCHDLVCFESEIVDDRDLIEVTCPNCDEVVYVNDGSYRLKNLDYRQREQHYQQKTTEDI